jgi:hypothetical protein
MKQLGLQNALKEGGRVKERAVLSWRWVKVDVVVELIQLSKKSNLSKKGKMPALIHAPASIFFSSVHFFCQQLFSEKNSSAQLNMAKRPCQRGNTVRPRIDFLHLWHVFFYLRMRDTNSSSHHCATLSNIPHNETTE